MNEAVAGPLECLRAGVTFEGLYLRVDELEARHALQDPNAH